MLGINVVTSLLGTPDSRPEFEAFPYRAQSVLQGESSVTFNNRPELDSYLLRVYRESLDFNKSNSSGAILDTFSQMPYFCNIEIFLSNKFQHDIRRYMYADQTGSPPYPGGYGEAPQIWIEKYYIIRGIINTHQNREIKKHGKS